MLELAAAALLLAGSGTILLAAIGIARFPDAFLRMHAATKAGVVGTGLLLAGVALAFGDGATIAKVTVAIALLLATTPIASHVLGRAAWLAAAPIAPGTRIAAIAPALPRASFDTFPAVDPLRPLRSAFIARQEDSMLTTRVTMRVSAGARSAPGMAASLDEVVLAVAAHAAMPAASRCALDLAAASAARLTVLAVIDTDLLSSRMAVPVGGIHYAARLARTQLTRARDRAAEAARQAVAEAAAVGVEPPVRYVEGSPDGALFARDRSSSIVVMPAGGWFDHGVKLTEQRAIRAQLDLDADPLLLVREPMHAADHVALLHDGSGDSRAAIQRFAGHPFLRDRELTLAGVNGCSEEAVNQVATILSRRGIRLQLAGRFHGREAGASLAACLERADVVAANRGLYQASWTALLGTGTWRIVQRTGRSLLLI